MRATSASPSSASGRSASASPSEIGGAARLKLGRLVLSELRPLIRLAGPVVLAEIGWMSMGLVDTVMVGRLGPAAIAATGMGSGVFTAIMIFGAGLMLGVDALVSRAAGAGRYDECLRWLHQGVVLALLVSPFVMLVTWIAFQTIDAWGLNPQIGALTKPYLEVIALSASPLMFYAAFRRYLQGIHVVRPIMYALTSANLVNAGANAILIYGRLGMPALGVTGSAWATCIARLYMAAFLYVAIRREHRRRGEAHPHVPFTVDAQRLWTLVALGAPAASQITLEVGVQLLAIAAAFQLFDGTQAVTTGVLRGIGDTRTPMVMNVIGHWVLGLPVGYALCFRFAWGVTGLWIGLSIGLIFCAVALTATWIARTRHLELPPDAHAPEPAEML